MVKRFRKADLAERMKRMLVNKISLYYCTVTLTPLHVVHARGLPVYTLKYIFADVKHTWAMPAPPIISNQLQSAGAFVTLVRI